MLARVHPVERPDLTAGQGLLERRILTEVRQVVGRPRAVRLGQCPGADHAPYTLQRAVWIRNRASPVIRGAAASV